MSSSPGFAGNDAVVLPQTVDDPVSIKPPIEGAGAPEEVLQVFVGQAGTCCQGKTPVAGRYTQEKDGLRFTPAFGFAAGQDYVLRLARPRGAELIPFRIAPEAAAVPAAVTEIFPSGARLPENTLRFYIHFSVPMQPQVAFDYVRLVDASGREDAAAFMRFKQELWNEDRTRLTVLIDPGRIKREVATNVDLGPALLAGQRYTLEIGDGWPSADGRSVLGGFSKSFTVSGALRVRPDTGLWRTSVPCAGTRDPLTVRLDRPFDRHLLPKALRIETGSGRPLAGQFDIEANENQVRFRPLAPWPAEDMLLFADPTLEDVAGNNFQDLLDHVAAPSHSGTGTTRLPVRTEVCTR